jgi:hypothetical protein
VVLYSVSRLAAPVAAGLLAGAGLLVWGIARAAAAGIAGGSIAVLLAGLFALGTRGKRRDGAVALRREGPWLVGDELPRALPVAETTFALQSDFQGSWVIVLRCQGATLRLVAGGWRIAGEPRVTRTVARRTLIALGLREVGQ